MAIDSETLTRADVAWLVGMSDSWVRDRMQAGDLPRPGTTAEEYVEAFVAYRLRKYEGDDRDPERLDKEQEQARLAREQADAKALGPAIASAVGGTLGKTLGSAAGPIGAIAGGILGNVVGGLFAKTKKGSSTLTFGADGLSAGAATGNSSSAKAAAAASANNVVGALARVAEER